MRENVKTLVREYNKTENDLKALQVRYTPSPASSLSFSLSPACRLLTADWDGTQPTTMTTERRSDHW